MTNTRAADGLFIMLMGKEDRVNAFNIKVLVDWKKYIPLWREYFMMWSKPIASLLQSVTVNVML